MLYAQVDKHLFHVVHVQRHDVLRDVSKLVINGVKFVTIACMDRRLHPDATSQIIEVLLRLRGDWRLRSSIDLVHKLGFGIIEI